MKEARSAANTDRRALPPIITLLFSLAKAADRAYGAPFPLLCYLLWVLRRAETAAQSIAGTLGYAEYLPLHHFDFRCDGSRADALRLGRYFRALACELRRQKRTLSRFASSRLFGGYSTPIRTPGGAQAIEPSGPLHRTHVETAPYDDTS